MRGVRLYHKQDTAGEARSFTTVGSFLDGAEQIPVAPMITLSLRVEGSPLSEWDLHWR